MIEPNIKFKKPLFILFKEFCHPDNPLQSVGCNEQTRYDYTRMYEIPLFPLNMVLFPGMPVQLHIFEPRYRQMMHYCLDQKQPFGVVLIQQGVEAHGPLATPYSVGCSAQIANVKHLKDGRMYLTALGEDRFRILELSHDLPYLVGKVEATPLDRPYSLEVARGIRHLVPWVRGYLELVSQIDPKDPVNLEEIDLPEDPLMLIYLAAAMLQVPATEKQALLEASTAGDLMTQIMRLYRRENAILQRSLEGKDGSEPDFAWLN